MAITEVYTVADICRDALRKIGVVAVDEEATADEIQSANRALNRMLKAWQAQGYRLWTVSSETVTATTNAEHSFASGRPLSIQNMRVKRSGVETQMIRMTREEYDNLPLKTATGIPTQFYFDRQKDAATVFVWPVFASVTTETFEVTYVREIEDTVLTAQIDVPSEWYDAVIYGLAARLLDDYMVNMPSVAMRAEDELRKAMAFDVEDSVYFVEYC